LGRIEDTKISFIIQLVITIPKSYKKGSTD
jgi:hypothetical protein